MTESEQRRRLAAAFRWSARLGFNEAVANHFSALVPGSDHEFLLKGGVFSKDQIESYLELKQEEQDRFRMTTHPVEFDMYYSL